MMQIGNEINHDILWPDGTSSNIDNLANFVKAGIMDVKDVSSEIKFMLHIAWGGQNKESR